MDPLSISASLVALLQITSTVAGFLREVHNAPVKVQKLLLEVCNVRALLVALNEIAKFTLEPAMVGAGAQTWLSTLQTLSEKPNGPLIQFETLINRLAHITKPALGTGKIRQRLALPFRLGEADEIVSALERLKSHFTLALQNDHIRLSRAIQESVSEIREDTQFLRQEKQVTHDAAFYEWLSPLDFPGLHEEISIRRQPGTCQWLLKNPNFSNWLETPGKPLWCSGIPGAGKTIVASFVIDHVANEFRAGTCIAAFNYCRYDERKQQSARNLIGSILRQLCQQSSVVFDEVHDTFIQKRSSNVKLTTEVVSTLLKQLVPLAPHFYIVVDALDELAAETRDIILNFLGELAADHPIHLLFLSRHLPTTNILLSDLQQINIRASDEDVHAFLRNGIPSASHLARHVKGEPAFHDTVVDTITRKSQGMFLMARFHLSSLLNLLRRRDVKNALDNLPNTPEDFYDGTMKRIFADEGSESLLARRVLSWMTYSYTQLAISDLQVAMAVEPGDRELDGDAILEEDILIEVCHGLIMVDQGIVRFVHYTAQEYFKSRALQLLPQGHRTIITTCLTCLRLNMPDTLAKNEDNSENLTNVPAYVNVLKDLGEPWYVEHERFPIAAYKEHSGVDTIWSCLRRYAAAYWGFHACEAFLVGPEEELQDELLAYLRSEDVLMKVERACLCPLVPNRGYHWTSRPKIFKWYAEKQLKATAKTYPGLLVAASFGLEPLITALLTSGIDVSTRDHQGRTALHLAAASRRILTVRYLLYRGVDPNARDMFGLTAFHYILTDSLDWTELAQIFLACGSVIDYPEESDREPFLIDMCYAGDLEKVTLLLTHGADVNTAYRNPQNGLIWETPLSTAVARHDYDLAALLISYKADPNVILSERPKYDYMSLDAPKSFSMLGNAQRDGNLQMQHLLLDAGAVNCDDNLPWF